MKTTTTAVAAALPANDLFPAAPEAPIAEGGITLDMGADGNRAVARATIVPGQSITLHGVQKPRTKYVKNEATGKYETGPVGATPYANHFAIGDWAECHSYNLVYTGRVRKITAKQVWIVEYEGTASAKTYRHTIEKFDRRNWDFDHEQACKRNSEWTD